MAVFEVVSRLHFKQQYFVAGTKRQQPAAIFKTDGRPIQWRTTDESLKKVLYFRGQKHCRLPVKFFFLSPVELFSKHPQKRHGTLNTTTVCFHLS